MTTALLFESYLQLTGAARMVVSTAQFPQILRCSYNIGGQFAPPLALANRHNWTQFAVFYDSQDSYYKRASDGLGHFQ